MSPGSVPRHARHRERTHLPLWQESLLLLAVAMVLAVGIKALFLQAFYIPSGSMNDTLVLDDRILVQKVSYWGGGEPERGDIVVFADPGGWLDGAAESTATNPATRALEEHGPCEIHRRRFVNVRRAVYVAAGEAVPDELALVGKNEAVELDHVEVGS